MKATAVLAGLVLLSFALPAFGYDPDPDGSIARAAREREGWRTLLAWVAGAALFLGLLGLVIRSAVRGATKPGKTAAAVPPKPSRPAGYTGSKSMNMPDDRNG